MIDDRIEYILENFEPVSTQSIMDAFKHRLKQLRIDDIFVTEVDTDLDGNIFVDFMDDEGDYANVVFFIDDDSVQVSGAGEDDDIDDEEFTVADLGTTGAGTIQTALGNYPNLQELSWLNSDILNTILAVADDDIEFDAEESLTESEINERTKLVIRGGKKVRVALVRKVRRKIMSPAQKAGVRKAKMKRRAKKNIIARKRKKSMKIRKRSNMKSGKTPRGMKVAGGRNYKSGEKR